MPGYRAHVGFGIVVYCFVLVMYVAKIMQSVPFFTALEWFMCAVLGALFPDIDTKSTGQLLFYRCMAFFLLYCLFKKKLVIFVWASLLGLLPLLVHHRGLFHRIWFIVLASVGTAYGTAYWYPAFYKQVAWDATFFAAGALSHIILDQVVTRLKRGF